MRLETTQCLSIAVTAVGLTRWQEHIVPQLCWGLFLINLRHKKKELPRNLRVCICTVLGVEHAVCVHEVQNLSRLSIGGASWTQHIKSVF
jgi:hypothetical protein